MILTWWFTSRHYEQNRAPLGLYLHAAWFVKSPEMMDALLFWLDEVLRSYDDVYIVSMSQVLAWMQSPTSSNQAVQFSPWLSKCSSLDTPDTCEVRKNYFIGDSVETNFHFQFSNDCYLTTPHLSFKQRLQTCNSCPEYYPWLRDTEGSIQF